MNTKYLLLALCLTNLTASLRADVAFPTVSLDASAPQLTFGALVGGPLQVSLASDGATVSNVRWFRNDTTQVGSGGSLAIWFLDYSDSGLYFARYTVGADERRSQSFAVVVRPTAKMVNISTRCLVTNAKPAIAGFIVSEPAGRKRFLIRAIGPSLARFGVTEPLARPTMRLFQGDVEISAFYPQRNGNSNSFIVTATQSTGAFALEDGTNDLAAFTALHSGLFTVQVGTEDGSSGEVLVEIYEYD